MLGGALLAQKKYQEAEPLLLKGYVGLKERQATIPAQDRPRRLTEALERLVQLYEATGQADDMGTWYLLSTSGEIDRQPATGSPIIS